MNRLLSVLVILSVNVLLVSSKGLLITIKYDQEHISAMLAFIERGYDVAFVDKEESLVGKLDDIHTDFPDADLIYLETHGSTGFWSAKSNWEAMIGKVNGLWADAVKVLFSCATVPSQMTDALFKDNKWSMYTLEVVNNVPGNIVGYPIGPVDYVIVNEDLKKLKGDIETTYTKYPIFTTVQSLSELVTFMNSKILEFMKSKDFTDWVQKNGLLTYGAKTEIEKENAPVLDKSVFIENAKRNKKLTTESDWEEAASKAMASAVLKSQTTDYYQKMFSTQKGKVAELLGFNTGVNIPPNHPYFLQFHIAFYLRAKPLTLLGKMTTAVTPAVTKHEIPYTGEDTMMLKSYGFVHPDHGKKFDSYYDEIVDTVLLQRN